MADRSAGGRVRRVFWTLFALTVVSVTWLWDQLSSDTVVFGRATALVNVLAIVIGAAGALLMARIVWRLSGREGRENRR